MKFDEETKNMRVICNCCEKEIKTENGIEMEGVMHINKEWGYFSKKDGEMHRFDMCEECYDKLIKSFKIPISIVRKTEML